MKKIISTIIISVMLLSVLCFAGCTDIGTESLNTTTVENGGDTEVETEDLNKLYYVTPWDTSVEAFLISDSASYSESTDVGGKTVNVQGPCTLSAAESVEIGIYVLEKGTTLDRFCEEVWDEENLEYTKIPEFRLSTRDDGADLPQSIFLDEGTYVVEVIKGGDGVYVHLIVGDGQSAN